METQNITLSLDRSIVKMAKMYATEHDKSVSLWVAELIKEALARDQDDAATQRRLAGERFLKAAKKISKTMPANIKPMTREEANAR